MKTMKCKLTALFLIMALACLPVFVGCDETGVPGNIPTGKDTADQEMGEGTTAPEATDPEEMTAPVDPNKPDSEGLEFVSNGDGTCYVSGIGTCKDLDVVIPLVSPDGDRVTSIGDMAFFRYGLTSIIIPDSVISIGNGAFARCSNLVSVTIPDSVTSIGIGAFELCESLTSITIPNSVTSIDVDTFRMSGLTSIVIPDSMTSIGNGAFGISNLTSIVIPSNVTSIGDGAFERCSDLTSITVEEGNSVYHSDGNCLIETASKTVIAGCKTSILPTDGSVTKIGGAVFVNYTDLTSIVIPDSVTRIGEEAFLGCTGLTSITFEGTVDKWKAVVKGTDWNINVPATEVICSDGTVSIK